MTVEAKIIRTIPGRAKIGDTIKVTASENRLLVADGKVAGEPAPVNRAVQTEEVVKRGRGKRK
mgnify:CR=1 FL=1